MSARYWILAVVFVLTLFTLALPVMATWGGG
jgi:hypothetical protein